MVFLSHNSYHHILGFNAIIAADLGLHLIRSREDNNEKTSPDQGTEEKIAK